MTPDELFAALARPITDAFMEWAQAQDGLTERIDEQQTLDLAEAFWAGYRHGQKIMREFDAGATS